MCGRGGERRECVAGQSGGTAMACGWLAGSGPTGCLRQLGASSQTDQPCALHRYTHLVNATPLLVHTVVLLRVGRQVAHSQHNIRAVMELCACTEQVVEGAGYRAPSPARLR